MNDKYKTYSVGELASDEAFISWIKEKDPGVDEQWEKWLADNPDKRQDVESAKTLVQTVIFKEFPTTETDKTALWNKIERSVNLEAKPIPAKRKISILKPAIWAAAATIAFFLIFKPFAGKETTVIAKAGQHETYDLPDNSKVTLNAGSEIGYYPKKWDKGRNIRLEGEAFFEVEKGTTFVVFTKTGEVEVLGTSFNVLSRAGTFEVYCRSGKVKVSSADGRAETILTPGNSAVLNSDRSFEKMSSPDDRPLEWMRGVFRFEADKLEAVFDEVERQYDVDIQSDNAIDTMRFTGSFQTGDLEKALNDITWPMGLTTKVDGNSIMVTQ